MKISKYPFCRGFNSEYNLWVLLWWRHYEIVPQGTAFCYSFSVGKRT